MNDFKYRKQGSAGLQSLHSISDSLANLRTPEDSVEVRIDMPRKSRFTYEEAEALLKVEVGLVSESLRGLPKHMVLEIFTDYPEFEGGYGWLFKEDL